MWEERRGEVGGEKRASGRRGEKKQTRVESNTDTRGCSSAWEIHKERQGDTRGCAPETILCGTHFARFFCAMPSSTMPSKMGTMMMHMLSWATLFQSSNGGDM